MGRAYAQDLRRRVFDCIASGHSCRAAGRVFGVSASTAIRLAAEQRQTGRLARKRQGGAAGKLAPHAAFLLEIVAAEPDLTLAELTRALAGACSVTVDLSSIQRALARAGLSYEKRPDRAGTAARHFDPQPA